MEVLSERFFNRFTGLLRAYGTYSISGKVSGKGKITGPAKTFAGDVIPALWKMHLMGEQGLGLVPINDKAECRFGAIDIDVYEGLDLKKLEKQIALLNLPLIVCRTKSGGAHLYLFTSEPTPAKLLRGKLIEWAVSLGYPKVEIFPKQVQLANDEDFGSWINMPYFDGANTLRYAIKNGKPLTPVEFLDLADSTAITIKQLEEVKVLVDDLLTEAPPCLQSLSISGFQEATRNNSLFSLAVYAKKRFGDTWVSQVELMNRRFMQPPLESKEVTTIIKSIKKKNYFYKCNDQPICSVCNKQICMTRKFGIRGESNDPGVIFTSLTKIDINPPSWILGVNDVRIQVKNTEDLMNQSRLATYIFNQVHTHMHTIKKYAWEELMQGLLEKLEVISAPEDAGAEGQFLFLVEQFCSERAAARIRDEIILGKPWIENGRVYFRSVDLLKYLDQNRFREVSTSREAWAIIRQHGAGNHQFNVKGKCVKVWFLPTSTFCMKHEEPLEAPRISGSEEF